jgi:putative ABC transport system permease protein
VLARVLGVQPGDRVVVEVLEGERPRRIVEVVGVANELIGATAYMEMTSLGRLAGSRGAVSGAYLAIDPRQSTDVYARLKRLPAVRAVGVRQSMLEGFERTIEESFTISLVTMMGFACIIAFGMVYNGARVALSERARELASLRVLGFSRREVTVMLLGEQAILATLAAPVGSVLSYALCWLLAVRFQSELYRLPLVVSPGAYALGIAVIAGAALVSGLAIRARVARLDLVSVLKTRE